MERLSVAALQGLRGRSGGKNGSGADLAGSSSGSGGGKGSGINLADDSASLVPGGVRSA